MSISIEPFRIDIPSSEVERMKRKLEDARLPPKPIVPDAGDDYGPSMPWIHDMYTKLLAFDWSAAQDRLNQHAHFLATIPDPISKTDMTIHFTHTKSSHPSAMPILLIHGWPGSIHEFNHVIEPLANPPQGQQALHVVVPSLPGFLWSSPPPRGWTLRDTARLFNALMLHLGYEKYIAQAGDWGMFVARELGANPAYNTHCVGVHLNFSPTPLPPDLKPEDLTERERWVEERCQGWLDNHLGYAVMMRTRPHTLGVALYDSPLGILLWVGEKYWELCTPSRLNRTSTTSSPSETGFLGRWEEDVLTTVCLYHFSSCIMTSMLPYFENVKHAGFGEYIISERNRIKVPFGFMSCLYDSRPGTKRGVERSGDLLFYREYDDVGHFAALEAPGVLVRDVREFVREHVRL
jgi:pimeloyl-ACP methyl ester carboxylesterase